MLPEFTLLIAAFLAIAMIYLSIRTGQRIFNLAASGIFLHLAITLSEHVALLIVFIALILWQLYYTFFAEVK